MTAPNATSSEYIANSRFQKTNIVVDKQEVRTYTNTVYSAPCKAIHWHLIMYKSNLNSAYPPGLVSKELANQL